MVTVVELWLPIVVSAVLVFIASSVIHMCLPVHKGDFRKLPGEVELLAAIRARGIEPGAYAFPRPGSMKEMSSPEMLERYRQGPVGFLTVLPSRPPAMGKALLQWFLYTAVISTIAAHVATLGGLESGAAFLAVFRLTAAVAILGHAVSAVPDSIWKGQPWTTTLKFIGDGIAYGLITGATFGWLWPSTAP